MQLTNHSNLPDPIFRAVSRFVRDEPPPENRLHVTELISPPRLAVLKRRHWHELTEDVSDRIYALEGQIAHNILELADDDAITEHRLEVEVRPGISISGRVDRIAPDTIVDYKRASIYSTMDGPRDEWAQQLNIYRWMYWQQNGEVIDRLQVVALYRDWSINKCQGADYPNQQVETFQIPVWPFEETGWFIQQRVKLHLEARQSLPECSAEDRWARPHKWAVMKEGRKSAIRLLDSPEEAVAWAQDNGVADGKGELKARHYIEYRPGQSVRCENYCIVGKNGFCEQWNQDPTNPANKKGGRP